MYILMYEETDGSFDQFEPILCEDWDEVVSQVNYYHEDGESDEDQMFDKNKFVAIEFKREDLKKVIN